MSDEQEYIGNWWLPNDPETILPGTLIFEPEKGLTLILNGLFHKDQHQFDYYEIILGSSHEGKLLTLYRCYNIMAEDPKVGKDYTEGVITHPRSTYIIHVGFEGFHYHSKKDILFNNFIVNFYLLEYWLGYKIVTTRAIFKDNKIKGHEIVYDLPKICEYNLDEFNVQFGYALSVNTSIVWKNTKVIPNSYIYFKLKKNITLEDILQLVYKIRNFVSLGIGKSVEIVSLTSNLNEKKYGNVIFLFKRGKFSKKVDTYDIITMLYRFKEISDNALMYLDNWFKTYNKIEPVLNLFFAIMHLPNLYPVHEFLSLMQALEAYHSLTFENNVLTVDIFENIGQGFQGIIRSQLPSPEESHYRAHFYSKIKYMNKKILRLKLEELFSKYNCIIEILTRNKNELINKLVVTRNYYTHYDEKLKGDALKELDLIPINQTISCILVGIILKEIGFTNNDTITKVQIFMQKHGIKADH